LQIFLNEIAGLFIFFAEGDGIARFSSRKPGKMYPDNPVNPVHPVK